MNWKLVNDEGGARTFVLVFAHGDTVMEPLLEFLKEQSVGAARLSGIGALESVVLGYFDRRGLSRYDRPPAAISSTRRYGQRSN